MRYDQILTELQTASLFEVYRLHAAMQTLLDDPQRLAAAKRQLKPGTEIEYFDSHDNALIPALVLRVNRTRALVKELKSGKNYEIPIFIINVEGTEADIRPQANKVDRLTLKVGDAVGFVSKHGDHVYGNVVKLNPKRAKLSTSQGIWTVPYSMLYTVIDGEHSAADTATGELITLQGDWIEAESEG